MSAKETALAIIDSKPLAIPTETVKTFWKIAKWPLVGPVKWFRNGYNAYKHKGTGSAVMAGYSNAFHGVKTDKLGELYEESPVPMVTTIFSAVGGGILTATVLTPALASGAVLGIQIVTGLATGLLVVPAMMVLAPVAILGVATAACAFAGAVWAVPVGIAKGIAKMFKHNPDKPKKIKAPKVKKEKPAKIEAAKELPAPVAQVFTQQATPQNEDMLKMQQQMQEMQRQMAEMQKKLNEQQESQAPLTVRKEP